MSCERRAYAHTVVQGVFSCIRVFLTGRGWPPLRTWVKRARPPYVLVKKVETGGRHDRKMSILR